MRKKEFEKAIRDLMSQSKEETMKQKELSEIFCDFLASPYTEDAINLIERSVLTKYKEQKPPVGLHKTFLEAAKYYRENGMYDKANRTLKAIEDTNNMNVLLQAKMEKELIKLRQATEQGEIDQEAIEEMQKLVAEDEEGTLDVAQKGKFTDYDLVTSYFKDIPVAMMNKDIFPTDMHIPTGATIRTEETQKNEETGTRNTQYIEALSAEKRLEFFKRNFSIERVRVGKDKFTGTILFEIQDSDLVIAENFYKMDREGNCLEDYGKATYILPKEATLDLIQLSRGELQEKIGAEGQIAKVRHNSETYYDRVVEKFNALQSAEYEDISVTPANLEAFQEEETKGDIDITRIPSEIGFAKIDNAEERKQEIRESNIQFLNGVNEKVGGLFYEEMIEGLVSRATYSFENVYTKKLQKEIMERLEVLEVPEEEREVEAQKVLVYMRMMKPLSMINSGHIKGEQLENILDASALEYHEAIEFYKQHQEEGLSYGEMKKGMKQYVETGEDILAKQPPKEEKKAEKNQEGKETLAENHTKEPPQELYQTLIGEEVHGEKRNKLMDMAMRFSNLMQKYEHVNRQLERANAISAMKIEEYTKALQEAKEAKEREEAARRESAQKKEQADVAEQAMLEAQSNEEEIRKEQELLQDKLSKIEELLR